MMATNMDKAVYTDAPQGIEQLGDEQEPIEIQIEDPEAVSISGPGFEIEMEKTQDEDEFNKNLAEEMSEDELVRLAGDLIGEYEADVSSRKDWIQTYVDGLELLGMKFEERMVARRVWCLPPHLK